MFDTILHMTTWNVFGENFAVVSLIEMCATERTEFYHPI